MLLPAGRLLLQRSCGGGRRCYQFGDAAAVALGWRVPAIWVEGASDTAVFPCVCRMSTVFSGLSIPV
jgi:hypothetical protein